MSDFKSLEAFILEQAIDVNSTTQKHPLGTIIRAEDRASTAYGAAEFIYLKGVASTVVGDAVTYLADGWTTARLVVSAIGPVAFAMAVTVANEFGWYQIGGKAVGKVKAGFADNGNCYSTSTAGSMDDAIVAGDRVQRCKGASAIDTPSTGLAELEIDRPYVNDALAD